MGTITYRPLDLVGVIPGQQLNAAPDLIEIVGGNDRWINTTCAPVLFSSSLMSATGAASASQVGAFTNAGSGSPAELARWSIRGNTIRSPITVSVWAMVNNGGTTGTLTVSHGGATATQAVTATSATAFDITITPTSGSAPLELLISGHTDDSNYVVLVAACARYAPTDREAGGTGSDGYAPLGDQLTGTGSSMTYANKPVPTEWLARGWNNMRALARDRVACLATLCHPMTVATTRGNSWTAYESSAKLVGRLHVDGCDNAARSGVLSVYMYAGASTTGKLVVMIGGGHKYELTINASGWQHQTIDLPAGPTVISMYGIRSTGSNEVSLMTAQVFRQVT
jgi:hypothetical protein